MKVKTLTIYVTVKDKKRVSLPVGTALELPDDEAGDLLQRGLVEPDTGEAEPAAETAKKPA